MQASADGELVVARTRLVVVFVLLALSLQGYVAKPYAPEVRAAVPVAIAALVIGAFLMLFVRSSLYRARIGFFMGIIDVTLVSFALAIFLGVGVPHAAVDSHVVFSLYFLVIASTGVRLDHRVSVVTGLVAVAEYLGIIVVANSLWDLNNPVYAPFEYGMFAWQDQFGRMVLLACAGLISTIVVVRAQKLRLLSSIDPLTGVMNRRAFDERLLEEYSRARRYGRPVSVAMIDIDYFKHFNDTYGHAAGDEALRSVAAMIRSRMRSGDVVARYGGEEFVVVLPEIPAATAVATAEALRSAIAANPLTLHGLREKTPVTVSIGVASWPEHGSEISRLIERADDRMYEAKLAGRDQVVGPSVAVRA